MKEKILDYLDKGHDYVSGDQISRHLGISRQALWKHIQELKDLGYEILAIPHLGYRLQSCPDRLFAFEVSRNLHTKFTGKTIHYFDYLSSTMDLAMQLGMRSSAAGTLVLAESQTKGRGRLGRVWFSPKYKGIYFSLILRPEISPADSPILTTLAAVSITEAVKQNLGLESQIKWPNDLFMNKKKYAGILTEMNAEMDKINFVVMGAGINVNNDNKSLIAQSTSLKEQLGQAVNRVSLLQEILKKTEENYFLLRSKGNEAIINKCRSLSSTLGKRVKIYCRDKHIEGSAVDIDKDGGLLVRKETGLIQKVMSGDVIHCR